LSAPTNSLATLLNFVFLIMSLRQKPRVDYSQFFENALDGLSPNSKLAITKPNTQLKLTELQIPKLNTKKRKKNEDDNDYCPENSVEKENCQNISAVASQTTETPNVPVKKLKRSQAKSTTATTEAEVSVHISKPTSDIHVTSPEYKHPPETSVTICEAAVLPETETSEQPAKEKKKLKNVKKNDKVTTHKKAKSKKASSQQSELDITQEAVETAASEDTDWKTRYVSLRDNFRLLKKKYNKLCEEQNNTVKETTSSLTTLSSELRAQAKELTEVRAQFSTLQVSYDKLKTELEAKQTLIKTLERENETLKEQKTSKNYEERIRTLESELQAIQAENTQLRQLEKEHKAQLTKLEEGSVSKAIHPHSFIIATCCHSDTKSFANLLIRLFA